MIRYLVWRLSQSGLTILFLLTFTSAAIRLTGDPTATLLLEDATAADRVALRGDLDLDEPLWRQCGFDRGKRAGALTAGAAVPSGMITARRRGEATDHVIPIVAQTRRAAGECTVSSDSAGRAGWMSASGRPSRAPPRRLNRRGGYDILSSKAREATDVS